MAKQDSKPNQRRQFLKGATTAGAIVATSVNGLHAKEHGHDHNHSHVPDDLTLRVKSLESLLVEKDLVDPASLDVLVDTFENKVGPRDGAKIVARAWVDPTFKEQLLSDGEAAVAAMGYTGFQGEQLMVLENTPTVHNVVACTLCSCYPWLLLGLPPTWYKSDAYRARIPIDPRGVIKEISGMELLADVEVRVWDSNATSRYMVLPERPAGTESMGESQLAELVTRDSMIGVTKITAPSAGEPA